MVRKVDSDGGKMVNSVGTHCLQNSPSGNIQCKAGNKGLECRGKKPVLDAPLGNHIHPRATWPGQVSQNQLLCSDAPSVSICNILHLAKHKMVDDKAHEEGSFTSNFVSSVRNYLDTSVQILAPYSSLPSRILFGTNVASCVRAQRVC